MVKEIKVDESYARSIVIAKGAEEVELNVEAIFVELSLTPNSECVANLVELNNKKRVRNILSGSYVSSLFQATSVASFPIEVNRRTCGISGNAWTSSSTGTC